MERTTEFFSKVNVNSTPFEYYQIKILLLKFITIPRYNPKSILTFQLYDEIVDNMLIDDRLEDSTLHYLYRTHWLAFLKIPLANVISQNKVCYEYV